MSAMRRFGVKKKEEKERFAGLPHTVIVNSACRMKKLQSEIQQIASVALDHLSNAC